MQMFCTQKKMLTSKKYPGILQNSQGKFVVVSIQPTFTCSKSIRETVEKGVKYVQRC